MSPTQRTLAALRSRGLTCEIVEKWIPPGKRRDLYGWIDILGFSEQEGIVGIQSCTAGTHQPHLQRILVDCRQQVQDWLRSGGKAELWTWRKVKRKRGSKAIVWRPRVTVFVLEEETNRPCTEQLAAFLQSYFSQQGSSDRPTGRRRRSDCSTNISVIRL